MKKSILNIKLTERLPARDYKTQNGTNSGVLDNRTKDFRSQDPVVGGNFDNQAGLVEFNTTIRVPLIPKKPFTANWSMQGGMRN
ncbi:unnamed protein product [Prunus armeniaca]|uniref:Uncharacterized protein n=1 Tax=Prunus armeniaca TaxID=36596 RepID=A0A6J5U4D8_PRUAR|nr:unnamed protein product [Prunus armeniaca]